MDRTGSGITALFTACWLSWLTLGGWASAPATTAAPPPPPQDAGRVATLLALPAPEAQELERPPPEPVDEAPQMAARSDEPAPPEPAAPVATEPTPSPVRQVRASKPRAGRCAEPDPRIRASGSGAWTVERSIVQEYTASVKAINQLGWVQKHDGEDGRSDGLLLRGVRCGSPLHAAGLRSGDVVRLVNGKRVRNLTQGLVLYASMRHKQSFVVEVTRAGAPVTLTYAVL